MTIKFSCPKCNCTRLECCESGNYSSEIIELEEHGDFEYGDIQADGSVDRFQCLICGYTLKDENDNNIDNNEEVIKWCQENCVQD